jgi:hypothetical protein
MKQAKENVHVWVTKYALSSGIFEADAEICHGISSKMISLQRSKDHYTENFDGTDWYMTKTAAIQRAFEMKEAKIKSLEKQIEKLRKMKF